MNNVAESHSTPLTLPLATHVARIDTWNFVRSTALSTPTDCHETTRRSAGPAARFADGPTTTRPRPYRRLAGQSQVCPLTDGVAASCRPLWTRQLVAISHRVRYQNNRCVQKNNKRHEPSSLRPLANRVRQLQGHSHPVRGRPRHALEVLVRGIGHQTNGTCGRDLVGVVHHHRENVRVGG